MRVGTMLKDVLASLFQPPVTQPYPFEKKPAPLRLRGRLIWQPDKCTGCGLCVKDCPSDAIEVIILDRAKKQFVMRYYMDRCTYCAQCVQNCRFKCIEMSNTEWELAALTRAPFEVLMGDQANIQIVRERDAAAKVQPGE